MVVVTDELVGKRAKLVALDESHVAGLTKAALFPEIWPYFPLRKPIEDRTDMEEVVASALAARDAGIEWPFTVIDRETGDVVGGTRYLDISPANRSLEIGSTWLTPSVWRTRINTECKYLLIRHAFETVGVIRVQFKTDLRNERSQKAMERIGCVKEGVLRRHRIMHDGYLRDSVYYSIIAEEWPDVKRRLEEMLER